MKHIYKIFLSLLIVGNVISCSDLEEDVYSEVVASTFYQTKEQILGAYTRPWAHTEWVWPHSIYHLNELSSDCAVWTAKTTGDGYDNGEWIALHKHNWTSNHGQVKNAWSDIWKGVAFINGVLEGIADVNFEDKGMPISKAEMVAQLRSLRAYYYYLCCDLWGNVPIVTKVADPQYPANNTRTEVYKFIETELTQSLKDLPARDHAKTYGYFTKSTANTLLAKLYINSEVFTGTGEYQKCIDACNAVINSKKYELDDNWQDPFKTANDLSNENIFAFALDGISSRSYSLSVKTLHYSHQEAFGLSFGPWNGIVTMESFYDSYADNDLRKKQYLIGPQYKAGTNEPVKAVKEYAGQPLVIVKTITALNGAYENEGARNYKYPLEPGTEASKPKNDLVVFRYADIIMTKAEAIMRKNGNKANQEAVDLVNTIRKRAFGSDYEAHGKYTTTTLTMDELLAERGREFAYEGLRRNDLIRFGKFNGAWWEKDKSDSFRNLYPIPLSQISVNSNLKQNPEY